MLAIPSVLCGFEIWKLRRSSIRRLKTAELRFMSCTAGYSLLDHRRNENILEELNIYY
jgi:hypothetical protein